MCQISLLLSLPSNKGHQQFLTSLSGRPKRNSLSKRPGLLRAGSMESSLFVAPITTTSPLASNPSIRAKRVDTMELQRQKKVMFQHRLPVTKSLRQSRSQVYCQFCPMYRTYRGIQIMFLKYPVCAEI